MNRLSLLQHIIDTYNKTSYLEIGVSNGSNFFRIKCKNKIAVDPKFAFGFFKKLVWNFINPYNYKSHYFSLESDTFFNKQSDYLNSYNGIDLVFVDGLHTFKNSLNDIVNSLKYIKQDGVIVVHDCFPPHERASEPRVTYPTKAIKQAEGWKGAWCGDVWKSIHYLSRDLQDKLTITVLNADYGLGIITLKQPWNISYEINTSLFNEVINLEYKDLMNDPKSMIHLEKAEVISLDTIINN